VGETAPLFVTILGASALVTNPLQPMGALSLTIFSNANQPFPDAQLIAWGTAFVLLVLVLVLSMVARLVSGRLNRQAR
jgi:phosphate transport system permease protein